MNIRIYNFAASCQQSTKEFDPEFQVFWEEKWSEWMTIGFRFLDILEDKEIVAKHNLLNLQVNEFLYDLPYFEFLIVSGYYTHTLQRFRYIVESWGYSYYVDMIFPNKSFTEKWKELENLSQNQWRRFLQRMPENHNLRGSSVKFQKTLHKYIHPDYKTLRRFFTDPAKKYVNLFDEKSYQKTRKIFLQLFDLLPLFLKNFEEDSPPLEA